MAAPLAHITHWPVAWAPGDRDVQAVVAAARLAAWRCVAAASGSAGAPVQQQRGRPSPWPCARPHAPRLRAAVLHQRGRGRVAPSSHEQVCERSFHSPAAHAAEPLLGRGAAVEQQRGRGRVATPSHRSHTAATRRRCLGRCRSLDGNHRDVLHFVSRGPTVVFLAHRHKHLAAYDAPVCLRPALRNLHVCPCDIFIRLAHHLA